MRAEEIMTREPGRCVRGDDVSAAAKIMWEEDCGSVPVVDERGMPIAMITDRDIAMAAYTRGCALHDMKVESVMSNGVRSCRDIDSVTLVEKIMAAAQVRRLPVVDASGRLVGIVALADVARARESGGVRRALEHLFADLSKTVAAISRPRTERAASR